MFLSSGAALFVHAKSIAEKRVDIKDLMCCDLERRDRGGTKATDENKEIRNIKGCGKRCCNIFLFRPAGPSVRRSCLCGVVVLDFCKCGFNQGFAGGYNVGVDGSAGVAMVDECIE